MGGVMLQDVMFDTEPLGLADTLQDVTTSSVVFALTEDAPDIGAVVYFGIELPIGEIAEAKAEVTAHGPEGNQTKLTLRILAVDAALYDPAVRFLSGESSSSAECSGDASGERQPVWALGLKQTNGLYASVVNCAGGLLTADQLRGIAEIAAEGAGVVKLTHAQRMVLLSDAEGSATLEKRLSDLGLRKGVLHHGVRNIRACCGALCRWSDGLDALGLSKKIDEKLYGRATSFDVKIALSDCMRNCSESYCADIGLIGKAGKYAVVVGGRGSGVPFRALVLKDGLSAEEATNLIFRVIDWYESHALEKERLYKTLERIGGDDGAMNEAFARIGDMFKASGDAFDEGARLKSMHARLRGVGKLRQELAA